MLLDERGNGITTDDVLMVKEPAFARRENVPVKKIHTIRDFDEMPEYPRVELIDGDVITMEAPLISHQDAVVELLYQTKSFIQENKGKCKPLISPLAVQPDENDDTTIIQPDFLVVCDPDKLKDGRHVIGAPDWVVEVLSSSTRKYDMGVKKDIYLDTGVREYWMVDLEGRNVIIYYADKPDVSHIKSMEEPVPVGIYDGELKIDFSGFEVWG